MSRAECEHRVAAAEREGVGKRRLQAAAQRCTGNVAHTGAFAVQIVEVRGRGRLLLGFVLRLPLLAIRRLRTP